MLYQRVPYDLTETSLRGRVLSTIAAVSIGTLFLLETKAYFSTTFETDLSFRNNHDEPHIRLNFDITMMDLPCEQAMVDVYSAVGYEKNVTRNIRKYPVDADGVRQRYEARNWHQNDIELWDPAIAETIDDLHKDGEDAINLDAESFPYGELPAIVVNILQLKYDLVSTPPSPPTSINSIGKFLVCVRQLLYQRLRELSGHGTYMGSFRRSCHRHIHANS